MNIYTIIFFICLLIIIENLIKNLDKKRTDNKNSKKIMSKSEYRIAQYLDSLDVKYKLQYTFEGCRDKQKLPFDFAIINDKGKVLLLIEYDGEQHFHPVNFKGKGSYNANKDFKTCQKHDKIKDKFCSRRHIPLLRIPYTENKNMYKIIKKTLYENNILK